MNVEEKSQTKISPDVNILFPKASEMQEQERS